jgi:MurNAc alpha-1-phosphate uridylyltransferase
MCPKAMILAAGRGERLRPLTDTIPKPLVSLAGKPLIVYHLEALVQAGIREVVINVAYQGKLIQETLGEGEKYGIRIYYSIEPEQGGLETGGGIFQALPLLGTEPFIVINSDIWTDYPLQQLFKPLKGLAHIILVDNPAHNREGDFGLVGDKILLPHDKRFTFAGISVYHPAFFKDCQPGIFSVTPLLKKAIEQQQVSGEQYAGTWIDIGTLNRLKEAEDLLSRGAHWRAV